MPYQVWIGLGSNQGQQNLHLDAALRAMQEKYPIRLVRESTRIYTTPVGEGLTGVFLNSVAQITTDLGPEQLLSALQHIEESLGRDRSLGPDRCIDLDILLMRDDQTAEWMQHGPSPQIPHPRMAGRSFVMDPLREILETIPALS